MKPTESKHNGEVPTEYSVDAPSWMEWMDSYLMQRGQVRRIYHIHHIHGAKQKKIPASIIFSLPSCRPYFFFPFLFIQLEPTVTIPSLNFFSFILLTGFTSSERWHAKKQQIHYPKNTMQTPKFQRDLVSRSIIRERFMQYHGDISIVSPLLSQLRCFLLFSPPSVIAVTLFWPRFCRIWLGRRSSFRHVWFGNLQESRKKKKEQRV